MNAWTSVIVAIGSALIGAGATWMLWLKQRWEDRRVWKLAMKIKRFCEAVQPDSVTETHRFTIQHWYDHGVIGDEERELAEKAALRLKELGILDYQSGGYFLKGHRPERPAVPQ